MLPSLHAARPRYEHEWWWWARTTGTRACCPRSLSPLSPSPARLPHPPRRTAGPWPVGRQHPHPTHPVQLEPSLPRANYAHLPPAGLFPRPVCRARTPPARGAGQPSQARAVLPPRSIPAPRPLSLSPPFHAFQQPAPHHAIGPFLLIPNLPSALARARRALPHRRFHHFSLLLRSLSPHLLQRHRFPWGGIFLVLFLGGVCVCGGGDVTRATWSPVDLPSREQIRARPGEVDRWSRR